MKLPSQLQTQINEHPRISVVMCTLNEEGNLPKVLPRIPHWVDEVILVDGHRPIIQLKSRRLYDQMRKYFFKQEKAKGDALKCGFQNATGDIIVTLDADGATDPEEIYRFVSALMQGYDFVKGTRLKYRRPPRMKRHRWFGNKLLVIAANLLFGSNYTDICSGYSAREICKIARMKGRSVKLLDAV